MKECKIPGKGSRRERGAAVCNGSIAGQLIRMQANRARARHAVKWCFDARETTDKKKTFESVVR